jgi:hypothetical protein
MEAVVWKEGITESDFQLVTNDLRPDEWEQIVKFAGIHFPKDLVILPGRNFTYFAPGMEYRPLVVGGFQFTRPGVMRSWFLCSDFGWRSAGWAVSRCTSSNIDFMFESGMDRVETICLASRKLAQRWYRTLGMRLDPTPFTINGHAAVMYVKEKGDVLR